MLIYILALRCAIITISSRLVINFAINHRTVNQYLRVQCKLQGKLFQNEVYFDLPADQFRSGFPRFGVINSRSRSSRRIRVEGVSFRFVSFNPFVLDVSFEDRSEKCLTGGEKPRCRGEIVFDLERGQQDLDGSRITLFLGRSGQLGMNVDLRDVRVTSLDR